ncbi:NADPH-dependent FMN reductase [Demequina sp. NBRC 110057]|uniref:NADPH-dependent FMN reductase n=1 Tax=Demequina sp. NBRC 110057 TaxID=1570346 RepID=UPI001356395B|nr:NADPH-dependent FMN reductase [Demequina sp. NBRC 110057]
MTTLGLLIGSLPLARTQRHLAHLLQDAAPAGTTIVELDPHALPQHAPYEDVPAPADALAWKRQVAEVDGIIVVTPTIERSIPGALKNAIDWAGGTAGPNALAGKPTIIAGVSLGSLPRFASIQHLRGVLGDHGAALRSQPEVVLFADPHTSFDAEGKPTDPDLVAEAAQLVSAAAGLAAHERRARIATPVTGVPAVASATRTIDPVTEVLAAAPGPQSPAVGIPAA